MKNKLFHRAFLRTVSIAGALLLALFGAVNAEESAVPEGRQKSITEAEWKLVNFLVETHGAIDWSQVTEHLLEHPKEAGNPIGMLIHISLANVFLNRYEVSDAVTDYEQAFQYFAWVAGNYDLWKEHWQTPGLAHYLAISVNRLRKECDEYPELPQVGRKQIVRLWKKVMSIVKTEADYRLTVDLPYAPHVPCYSDDSEAHEKAWEATLFATAASFLPDDSQAPAWDAQARQLAYESIARSSEIDKFGVKTCAGEGPDDSDNGSSPDTRNVRATIFLLVRSALTYRIAGRPVPEEFTHGLRELYEQYRSNLRIPLAWIVPSEADAYAEADGNVTFFALAFGSRLDELATTAEASPRDFRKPAEKTGEFRVAIRNSKAVLADLLGLHLRRLPSTLSCSQVRYRMPDDGEVQ